MAHHHQGRLADAIDGYRQALKDRPGDIAAIAGLGAALRAAGKIADAVAILEAGCLEHPDQPALLNNLGNAQGAAGNWMAAEICYADALALKPDYVEALANHGGALSQLGDAGSAAEAFDRASALRPDLAVLPYEAGKAWHGAGDTAAAIERLGRAKALAPGRADIVNDLGNALFDAGDLPAAAAAFTDAIAIDAKFLEPCFNRANSHRALGRLAEALADYEAALTIQPEHAEVRWNRALTHLLAGDWAAGFADYDWRWRRSGGSELPAPGLPRWDGVTTVDRHVLIASEQGYGDTLQFARYLPIVAARAGKVTFSCPAPLAGLMAEAFPGIEVTSVVPDRVQADCAAALLDLPGLLWSDSGMAGGHGAYLSRGGVESVPCKRPMKIGIVWNGSPSHRQDTERSMPLDTLRSLIEVSGVSFVSLQLDGSDEIIRTGLAGRIADPTAGLGDFKATRDVISALDLVIGVDTAGLHLAGAMGKPAWLLLAKVPDWRWGLAGDDTAWYPSHRLFRQSMPGDWRSPVQAAAAELSRIL